MREIRLLIVDDEDEFRQATARVLSRRGFIVKQAASGEEALDLVAASRPELILLDLKMPGMDGMTMLERLREQDNDIPVIILTGHGGFEEAYRGINLEITDFLQKPVDVEQLSERIRSILERSAAAPLREPTLEEIIIPPAMFHRISIDDSLEKAITVLRDSLYQIIGGRVAEGGLDTVLVYDEKDRFCGVLRARNIIAALFPTYLEWSPYAAYFTGMFLARAKVIGETRLDVLIDDRRCVDVHTPLLEAANVMLRRGVADLPVEEEGEFIGLLRERELLLEVARSLSVD